MTGPLIVLAIGAAIAGVLNLPFTDTTKRLENWLEPVVGPYSHVLTMSGGTQAIFATISAVIAIGGVLLAWLVYERHRLAPYEPRVLAYGWYYDDAVTAFMGGPGYQSFEDVAWFDKNVIDGGVNGIARLTRFVGRMLRPLQSGYVRNYALGIGLGAVLLLAWFVSRGAF
jgi:NADH-quinone oxidoreductase subunit L